MKRSTMAVTAILVILTGVGVVYNACSVRRFDSQNLKADEDSLGSTSPNSASRYLISNGIVKLTAAGVAANLPMSGRVLMVRDLQQGNTDVYVHVSGMAASATYPVHVHDQSCLLGGGAHYLMNKSITTAVETNEIWPVITTVVDGSGSGHKMVSHVARPEAQSIVIHDPTTSTTRLACGTFTPQLSASSKSGRFSLLAAGVTANSTINGNAVLIRNPAAVQSVVKVKVAGLIANTTYPAHVHRQPCNTGDGGAHYKMNNDVTEVTASTANELWVPLAANANGFGEARLEVDHVANADALSIVIHDPVTPANRLACVDLATDGGFLSTEVGLQKGRNILGSGKMERLSNGTTQASMSVSGLVPNTAYVSHVHDRPCHVMSGGGHYKLDYSNTAAVESNEIWIRFTTDANGAGAGSVVSNAIARPEAQSIVIHDPADSARIACMDIY